MAIISTDSLQLAMVEETVPGTTPATPAFDLWRTTGEGLVFSPQTSESAELGGTGRMKKPANVTGMSVSGSINFELAKFTALENAIAGVLANDWGVCPVTGTTGGAINAKTRISTGKTTKTYTLEKRFNNPAFTRGVTATASITGAAGGATAEITVAAPVGGAGVGTAMIVMDIAVDGGASQHATTTVNVGDDEDAVATAVAATLNALPGLSAAAVGAVVTITPDTATVDTLTLRQGADEYLYQRFKGTTFSTFSLSIAPNQVVTGDVGIIGGAPELDILPLPGATYVPAGNNPVFTAPQVLDLVLGDLDVKSHCFLDFSISIDSGNRGIACLGTQGEREVVLGSLRVEINGTVYFADQKILQDILDNNTIGDGKVVLSDGAGNYYRFDLFDLKPLSAQVAAGGQGQDLTVPITLQPTPAIVCFGSAWESPLIISTEADAPDRLCEPDTSFSLDINAGAGETADIQVKFGGSGGVYHVDWGDGTVAKYNTNNAKVTHNYVTAYAGPVTISHCTQYPPEEIIATKGTWNFALADLPASVTSLTLYSTSSTITGALADLPAGMTALSLYGTSSPITGALADLPAGMTVLNIGSTSSTITGALADLPASLTILNLQSTSSTITAGATFTSTAKITNIDLRAQTPPLSTATVDAILTLLATHTQWAAPKTIKLEDGTNGAPTAALPALAALQGMGVTVTTN